MADLSDIITSKVRVKILNLFFADVREKYHVRGIVREVKEEINAVRRELERLEKTGILAKEPRGNRLYYWPRSEYLYFEDILSIVSKNVGLGGQIIANRRKIGNVSFVMFSGKFARRMERKNDDEVDILMVGEVILPELASYIRVEESKRAKEINYTVMTRDEFEFRKKRRDPFLLGILSGGRIMIIGNESDLVY